MTRHALDLDTVFRMHWSSNPCSNQLTLAYCRRPQTSDSDDVKAKRFKRGDASKDKDDVKPKVERSSSETSGETSPRSTKDHSKPQEPPKPDYIHVRARRGQATDSHSLAERVRFRPTNPSGSL